MSDHANPDLVRLTRRQVLIGGALAGTAAFIAACGAGGTGTDKPAATTPAPTGTGGGPEPGLVNWANWTYYIDVDEDDPDKHPTLETFTTAFGTTVNYEEIIDDNNTFFGQIEPPLAAGKDSGWDIVTLTDWMAARLIRLGWVETFDLAAMPNFVANLKETYKGVDWDSTSDRHAPWRSGTTGLGYDSAVTGELTSLKSLYEADPRWKGKVEYLTEMRDAVGLSMLSLGLDPTKPTREGLDQAVALMEKAKADGVVRALRGNSYAEDLKSGDAVLCMAWAGDMIQAQIDKESLRYTLAEEGGMLWTDNMLIPKGAQNKAGAEQLIDYYYDPAVSAEITYATYYLSPCKGSDELLAEKYPDEAKNPLIVPPQDWVDRLNIFGGLSDEDETYFNEEFAKVIGVG